MKIVEQSVALEAITQPCFDVRECVASPQAAVIERAGRTCYKSEGRIGPDTAGKFVAMIERRGHASVLEHVAVSLRIVCDRGISHEIVRHRIASYSQESTRYINYAGDTQDGHIKVVKPLELSPTLNPTEWTVWVSAMMAAEEAYFNLIKLGCAPQVARDVLPTCTKTELVMTANVREWIHFLKMRSSMNGGAHPKMQVLGDMTKLLLEVTCPEIFNTVAYENIH